MARAQFSKDPVVDRSLRHSVRDGMAYSVQVGAARRTSRRSRCSASERTAGRADQHLATVARVVGANLLGVGGPTLRAPASRHMGCALQTLLWLPIVLVPVLIPSHAVAALLVLLACTTARTTSRRRSGPHHARSGLGAAARPYFVTARAHDDRHVHEPRRVRVLLHELDTTGRTYFGFALIFLIAFVARAISVYH